MLFKKILQQKIKEGKNKRKQRRGANGIDEK